MIEFALKLSLQIPTHYGKLKKYSSEYNVKEGSQNI
jgi:hypothetical protein